MSGTEFPSRKPLRLKGYDYSGPGVYFITACTQEKKALLAAIVGGGVLDAPRVDLTDAGRAVERQMALINERYTHLQIENYVIMPNHVHLLVRIKCAGPSGTPAPTNAASAAGPSRTPAPTNAVVPRLMSTLKRLTNKACGASLWQRGYHDHVIRDEKDCLRILQYMEENPAKWSEDRYYKENE